ncbi:MAG: glycosyltransferase [Deltaproteobacteria bacterium]|nr:glycosyltransferase [Deltaproteobacteria bacterium]
MTRIWIELTGQNTPQAQYLNWINQYDLLTPEDRIAILAHIDRFAIHPTISILMPTYNTSAEYLREALDSVIDQLYPHWELCIADDASTKPHVQNMLREYAKRDQRIKLVFRNVNGHISEASNSALELATGEFIALLDHDDRLTPHALYFVVNEINAHPEADLIYSDEDKLDSLGQRCEPHFKPDWNPDLMLSFNLITHLAAFRTKILNKIGGFRNGFGGAQDYDLELRVIDAIRPENIRHIPHVLYHWRKTATSTAMKSNAKNYAYDNARKAIYEHLTRRGWTGDFTVVPSPLKVLHRVVPPLPHPEPSVAIIIPTRDRADLLAPCLESILQKTTYGNYHIYVVDNQSRDESTLDYFKSISSNRCITILRYDQPFNYAAINNWATTETKSDLLALLNNDIEVISPDWLTEMVRHALRPEIGPVGAKLYYPNDTIQHGGVILGEDVGPCSAYNGWDRKSSGLFGRAMVIQNFSAVTAACLVIKRYLFELVGGFDPETFKVAYNDIDLCLRLGALGYRTLWTPYAELYHHESATLGPSLSDSRQELFLQELSSFKAKWKEVLRHDPAHNPNLTTDGWFKLASPPRIKKPWLTQDYSS